MFLGCGAIMVDAIVDQLEVTPLTAERHAGDVQLAFADVADGDRPLGDATIHFAEISGSADGQFS